jgi:hypothetical protein
MALSFLTVGVSRHQNKLFSLTRLSRGSFLFRYLLKAHRLCGTIYCTAPSIRDTAFYHRYYLLAMPASISRLRDPTRWRRRCRCVLAYDYDISKISVIEAVSLTAY